MVSYLFLDGQDGLDQMDSGQSVMNPLARSQTTHNYAAYAYLQKYLLNRYIANLDFNIIIFHDMHLYHLIKVLCTDSKIFLNLSLLRIFCLATYHWPHIFYITFTYLQVSFARGNLISRGRPFRMVRVAISVLLATFGCCGLQSYISINISSNAMDLALGPLICNLYIFQNG